MRQFGEMLAPPYVNLASIAFLIFNTIVFFFLWHQFLKTEQVNSITALIVATLPLLQNHN